ncbi:hypothetical protein [Actibacterium sp. D379-3]
MQHGVSVAARGRGGKAKGDMTCRIRADGNILNLYRGVRDILLTLINNLLTAQFLTNGAILGAYFVSGRFRENTHSGDCHRFGCGTGDIGRGRANHADLIRPVLDGKNTGLAARYALQRRVLQGLSQGQGLRQQLHQPRQDLPCRAGLRL